MKLKLSPPSYGDFYEAKTGVGQFCKCGPTQVDLSTLPGQKSGGPSICDFHNYASVLMRHDDLRAEFVEPRCRGALVGIEPLAIGHQ